MVKTQIVLEDEDRERKEQTGMTWEQLTRLGIETAEKRIQEAEEAKA